MQDATQTNTPTTPLTPVVLFEESYREIVRGEFNQSQRAWLRILSDLQEANTRWCARRQEMIRDSAAVWLDPRAAEPGGLADAWRRWASASARRWIDDVADQMEVGMKAAMCISDAAAKAGALEAEEPAKSKRAKKNGATHH